MKKKTVIRIRKTALAVLAALAMSCVTEVPADSSTEIAKDVRDWIRAHGQSVTETDAQHYNTAGRGIYTGGSLSVRTPNYYITPITISAPDLSRRGCGGVDLYFGSFSYLQKEELERFARQVLANAPYAAFKIALDSYMPKLNATLAELQSMAQLLSSTQLDACSTAEYMVNSIDAAVKGDTERPMTIANTFEAISSGFSDTPKKLPINRQDGTVAFVESLFASAGAYRESAKIDANAGNNASVDVVKFNGEVVTKNIKIDYEMDEDLKKLINASDVCGKAAGETDKLAADTNPEVKYLNQETILCREQQGKEGNDFWRYEDRWIKSVMAFANANDDPDVFSIFKSFNGKQQDLVSFIYATQGFYSQYTPSCVTSGEGSRRVRYDRNLTLEILINGGEYQPIRAEDHNCPGSGTVPRYHRVKYAPQTPVPEKGPILEIMKQWGNYCDNCKEKTAITDLASEKTTIAQIALNPNDSSGTNVVHYDEMRNILGDNVFHAVVTHAKMGKYTVASNIARTCLVAKIAEIYGAELLNVNRLISDSIGDNEDLSINTRRFLSTTRQQIEWEIRDFRDKYGVPGGSCIDKAGGKQSLTDPASGE